MPTGSLRYNTYPAVVFGITAFEF